MKIVLSEEAHKKIMHWVDKADFEVSGMGKVVHDPATDTFKVEHVYLVKQEGTSSTTDLDPAAMAQLMYKTREVPGMLSYWWHSHVNMSCFWSGTDKETITELGAQGLCVATVFNKKGEHRSAVCYKADSLIGPRSPWHDEVETSFESSIPAPPPEWDAEFEECVQRKKYTSTALTNVARSFDEGAWKRETVGRSYIDRGYSSIMYGDGYDDPVPYYAEKEAELLGMNPQTYWYKIQNANETQITEMEARLEAACMTTHGMKYDDWCKTLLMRTT